MRSPTLLPVLVVTLAAAGCGYDLMRSNADVPGDGEGLGLEMLKLGADALQSKAPVNKLDQYLVGFHFFHADPSIQDTAHHSCHILNDDFIQCAIFDGNGDDAKLIGVEYVISRELFRTLPQDEQKLWHPHNYEVKSGTLVAPRVPGVAERALMEHLVTTYGKTWHLWHTRADDLPLGGALLMKGATEDGQIRQSLIDQRDDAMEIDTAAKKRQRRNIDDPGFDDVVLEEIDVCETGLPHEDAED
jgi:hypothetical protein